MSNKVVSFELGWNPTANAGLVRMKFASGQVARFPVNSLADLAGWAALYATGSLFSVGNGWLRTEAEDIEQSLTEGGEVPFPF